MRACNMATAVEGSRRLGAMALNASTPDHAFRRGAAAIVEKRKIALILEIGKQYCRLWPFR
jgi:hypothetical protein